MPVPDPSSANPRELAKLACGSCPELSLCRTYPDLLPALEAAFASKDNLVGLCGSLYLVGHFLGSTDPDCLTICNRNIVVSSCKMKAHNEFRVEEASADKGRIAEQIIRALPEWFGIESAILQYQQDIESLPTYFARLGSEEVIGFLALKFHNIYSAEIYVMGVLPKYHKQHIGSTLIAYAQAVAYHNGCEYLAVKTLGPSLANPHYEGTRLFYFKQGFRPIEEFDSIWANTPCLLMVKRLFQE